MASNFPYLALIAWPFVAFVAFSMTRVSIATMLVLIGAMMFLPYRIGFDFPGVPAIGRQEIACLSILVALAIRFPARIVHSRPLRGIEFLAVPLVLSGFATVYTNGDPLVYGPTVLPALKTSDVLGLSADDLFRHCLPFFIGRIAYRSSRDLRDLLAVFVALILIYSTLMFVEIMLSPQLHGWIYGYRAVPFITQARPGGYRPVVFFSSPLALALFTAVSGIAAAALYKARWRPLNFPLTPVVAYVSVFVALCRSLASFIQYSVFLPVTLFLSPRRQLLVAVGFAVLIYVFPLARAAGLVPTEKMIDAAKVVSATRADSLEFRFRHEDALMERAKERFVFGWGGYNRSRVHDPKTGQDLSTVDGFWIITTGTRGIMGFACVFGLLLFPIFNAYRRLSRIPNRRDQALIAAVSLMIIMYAVDMIPNGLWLFLPFYLAGALEGITRSLAKAGTRVRKPRLRQNGPSAMQARA